ncbi:AT hook domain-containing protein [Seiridium cupressi]
MPTALHPQAKFDPIAPDLDLQDLVDNSPNLDWVIRLPISQVRRLGPAGFEKLVQLHVIEGGRPLVIDGWDKILPQSIFNMKWLEETYDKHQENVRDLGSQSDIPMTMGHYLRSMRQLTNQWSPTNFRDDRRQRLYLKDIDCPPEWFETLKKIIPPNVLYMNENISETAITDSRNDDDIFGAPEPTAAVAGDLMSCLPEEMRAQNLMCYIGHEGTYTPAHKEMCATLGQNIMVEASGNEQGEKPGTSIWFMTETKDREVVREYFLSMLGHDVEIEKHFAQINAWKKANFPVYVVEQKVGDFILIPPLAPHQVWNRGTRTTKVAWNRTTVETLDLALHEALPRSRLVCRDEQYKNKAIIYFALEKYHKELQTADESAESGPLGLGRELTNSPRLRQIANDFRRLFGLFTEILVDEMFGYKHIDTEFIEFDSNITCSYCRSNIFNRFLTCKCCVRSLLNGDEDTYDICMECYAMGRSCVCVSGLQWCEQWQWSDLVDKHETWRAMVIKQDGFVDIDHSPQPLEIARKKTGKKSIAQICQEQLRRRPWTDIRKPVTQPVAEESEPEPEVDDEGRVKKKSKPKRKVKKGDTYRCHVCCHKDYTYKLNFCTTCQEAYCYGVLFRAFDTMPQAAMEQEHWQCPKCLGICNCGSCRRAGNTKPYVPKSTLLGHDTRKVADDRSVETVVDFRIHNLSWLKGAGEETRSKNSKRMQRLKEQADAEKARDPLAALDAAEDAPHEMGSAIQDSAVNAESIQDLAFDNGVPNGSRVQMADMDTQNGEGDSSYPDPSEYPSPSMGGRMMGMGFYDQDDSADRILFDAFQMPSADAIDHEPEVSEYVKNTLRMAKRKARLETNDPDFRGPKSHHRKKPRTGNIDQLVNLDPALLGSLGNPGGSQTATPVRAEARSAEGSTAPEGDREQTHPPSENSNPKPARAPLPIEPLNPQLRHAKPTQSYVEAEDIADDPDDVVAVNPIKLFGTEDAAVPTNYSVDLAAEAIRALAEQHETPTTSSKPQSAAKRRGRPPGRPRSSLTAVAPSARTLNSAVKETKRRGRPPGASLPKKSNGKVSNEAEDTAMTDAEPPQNDGTAEVDSLEAELEAALTREDDHDETPVQRPSSTEPPAKRRGRPPGRKFMPVPMTEPEPESTPVFPRMMSMAERMAARGRKFKIRASTGSRKSPAGSSSPAAAASVKGTDRSPKPVAETGIPSPVATRGRKELEDDEFNAAAEEPSSEASSNHGESVAHKSTRGPASVTVVRMDQSEDSFGSSDSDSDSVFGDDDDEDGIPALPKYTATRGGRGRGRGASIVASLGVGRGRGRGRPRGR